MRTKTYILSDGQEKYVVGAALRNSFKNVQFEEFIEEKEMDRCWTQFTASHLAERYQKLGETELGWILEQKIATLLVDVYWGHAFSVTVQVSRNYNTPKGEPKTFRIRAHIEPLRERRGR